MCLLGEKLRFEIQSRQKEVLSELLKRQEETLEILQTQQNKYLDVLLAQQQENFCKLQQDYDAFNLRRECELIKVRVICDTYVHFP